MQEKVIIIGSGPAGIGTAYHLDREYLLLEAEDSIGGLMRSKNINGFIFDYAGHIFFTSSTYMEDLIRKLLGENFHVQERGSWIYSNNTYTRYPFQSNTYGLPKEIIKDCIIGIVEARLEKASKKPQNFKEYIYKVFGKGISEHFMIPYNEKIWTVPLEEMDCEWFEERVPDISIEDVVSGALLPYQKKMGQNATFGYPLHGGCESIPKAFSKYLKNVYTSSKVTSINLKEKYVKINNSKIEPYSYLVPTMPLPEFFKILADKIPPHVAGALEKLKYNSVLCQNIGINREKATEKHWIYFHEKQFIFQRVFVQSNASPYVVPPECSSYTAEITYSQRKPVDMGSVFDKTIEGLKEAGLMLPEDEVIVDDLIDIHYGYVIYDHNRKDAMKVIRKYLASFDVYLVGRYAEWEYYNMDTSILAGKKLAERLSNLKQHD
ncbi:NAD(P)-binding protein [bacterium]|nr:NAD(P)-binding protein [bacterium]